MRVLQINSFFSTGGPPRIVKGIYDTLLEQGHECVLAAGREKPMEGMDVIKIGTPLSKYWHLFVSRVFDAHGLASKVATKKIIRKIEEYNPDLIQLHNLHGYYLNYKYLFEYMKSNNTPVVWTLHDCWGFTGHCAHFDYIKCEKWKQRCYKCPQQKMYPKSIMIDASARNYDEKKKSFIGVPNMTIITPSVWLASQVKESFLKDYPIKVIYNGLDLKLFKPTNGNFKQRNNLSDKIIVLGVAQVWGERKGFKYFIEMASRLDDKFKLVMVGLSDKQMKYLPDQILGVPHTTNTQELIEIYSAADIFVNPTLEDTFPTTNLEALACGTPVITFDTGGSVESIDESCGLIVKQGSVSELIDAIYSIYMRQISSEACMNRAKLFNAKDRFGEYVELYRSLIC
jgi:putative colanic acid biosynthesis glycosyltransferase